MEETAEFGIRTALIVDKFHFHRFHWRDSQNSLTNTGTQTGQQFAARGQLSIVILHLCFERFKCAKSIQIIIEISWRPERGFRVELPYRTADFGMLP